MKVYSQLESACLEQLSSDPGGNTQGRLWANTTDGKIKYDDGVNKRQFLKNDQHVVIGNHATASSNVRLNRASTSTLQLLTADDVTPEGTWGGTLGIFSARLESYTQIGKPVNAQVGRTIFVTDTKTLSVDDGSAWNDLLAQNMATTKGDILARGATTLFRLPVGTNMQVLTADSTQSLGIKWASIGAAPTTTHNGAAYVAAIGDGLSLLTGTGLPYTVTLPSAAGNNGERLRFKRIDDAATTAGAMTLGFITTLNTRDEAVTLVSDGTTWLVEERYIRSYWKDLSSGEWTITGISSVGSKQAQWRRVGNTIEVRGYFTALTIPSSPVRIALTGVFMDMSSAMTDKILVGKWVASSFIAGNTPYASNNRLGVMGINVSLNAAIFSQGGTATSLLESTSLNTNAGDGIHFEYSFPIVGWNS